MLTIKTLAKVAAKVAFDGFKPSSTFLNVPSNPAKAVAGTLPASGEVFRPLSTKKPNQPFTGFDTTNNRPGSFGLTPLSKQELLAKTQSTTTPTKADLLKSRAMAEAALSHKQNDFSKAFTNPIAYNKRQDFLSHWHGYESNAPRQTMLEAIKQQSGNRNNRFNEESPIGYDLLLQRFSPETIKKHLVTKIPPVYGEDTLQSPQALPGGHAYVPRLNDIAENTSRNFLQQMGRPAIINHELEHAANQPTQSGRNFPYASAFKGESREIAPTIGDLVFMTEQFRRQNKKPLQHTVNLTPPDYRKDVANGGMQVDANWMADQAKRHGYFDGRSMEDLLLNTPEGQRWLQRAFESGGYLPETRQSE